MSKTAPHVSLPSLCTGRLFSWIGYQRKMIALFVYFYACYTLASLVLRCRCLRTINIFSKRWVETTIITFISAQSPLFHGFPEMLTRRWWSVRHTGLAHSRWAIRFPLLWNCLSKIIQIAFGCMLLNHMQVRWCQWEWALSSVLFQISFSVMVNPLKCIVDASITALKKSRTALLSSLSAKFQLRLSNPSNKWKASCPPVEHLTIPLQHKSSNAPQIKAFRWSPIINRGFLCSDSAVNKAETKRDRDWWCSNAVSINGSMFCKRPSKSSRCKDKVEVPNGLPEWCISLLDFPYSDIPVPWFRPGLSLLRSGLGCGCLGWLNGVGWSQNLLYGLLCVGAVEQSPAFAIDKTK